MFLWNNVLFNLFVARWVGLLEELIRGAVGLHHFGLLPLKEAVYLLLLCYQRKASQSVASYKLNTAKLSAPPPLCQILWREAVTVRNQNLIEVTWIKDLCLSTFDLGNTQHYRGVTLCC